MPTIEAAASQLAEAHMLLRTKIQLAHNHRRGITHEELSQMLLEFAEDRKVPSSFLTKVRHNRGGESVIGRHSTRESAQAQADGYNEPYQSDNAYIDAFDAEKAAAWPTSAELMNIVDAVKKRNKTS